MQQVFFPAISNKRTTFFYLGHLYVNRLLDLYCDTLVGSGERDLERLLRVQRPTLASCETAAGETGQFLHMQCKQSCCSHKVTEGSELRSNERGSPCTVKVRIRRN